MNLHFLSGQFFAAIAIALANDDAACSRGQRKQTRVTLVRAKSRTCIPIAIVLVCCWAARTRSEDVSEAPAGTRPLTATPFQLILPREHLLGDWFTTRT